MAFNDSSTAAEKHKFILFISGMSIKSGYAVENIRKICEQYLPGEYELQIIDLSKEKEQAANYQIIAVPTLIRLSPQPMKTILGDLSDTQKVLRILDLASKR